MQIHKVKSSDYSTVNALNLYDYIRDFANRIYFEVEPDEDGKGNSYKEKRNRYATKDKTQLKAIAAELETVHKRLEYIIHGRY